MGEHHHEAHVHGHSHDRGWSGVVRYLSLLPYMWTSEVSTAVVGLAAPRAGERVVDLGSGMGPATVVAAETGASVVAVDPTPFLRRILGARRLAQRARRRISVVEGAAEAIPVADASVDALWSVNTMHHWTELDRALREIHRVLRRGGRLVLVDEDMDDPAHPFHERFARRRAGRARHFEVIDPVDVAARLRRLGFASADGSLAPVAGRPARLVRGVKG
ncbi:MAG: class I SAM-dependent methyltransferase [Polyangiaceae bacterium]|nr:class I SAM-dependent methyltransferase [Polyangiaceae bacterium]